MHIALGFVILLFLIASLKSATMLLPTALGYVILPFLILESVFDGCSGIEELTLGKIQYKNQKEDYDSLEGDWVWAIYPFKDNCESIRKVSAPAPALHGFLKDCPNLDKDTLVYMKQQLTQMKETLQKQLRSIGMFALDPEGKKEKLKTKIKWLSEDLSQLNRRLRN